MQALRAVVRLSGKCQCSTPAARRYLSGLPVITLSGTEARVLNQNLSRVPLRGYQRDPSAVDGPESVCPNRVEKFEEMSFQAVMDANIMPLLDVRRCGSALSQSGAVLFRGIDYGPVAPTTVARAMHGSAAPEALIAGIVKLLGCKLVGYGDQEFLNTHLLFHDIRPVQGGLEGANGGGGLGMHMDLGFRPDIRPNFLILAGLREGIDPDVKTPIVAHKDLYRGLLESYPEDEEVLRDASAWDIRAPETAGSYRVHTPLLTGTKKDPVFHLRLDRMYPLNKLAQTALDHMHELVQENEVLVHLKAGDLLLLNNHKVMHRRSPVRASYDRHDRLLMRAYAKEAGSVPPLRIFPKIAQK